MRFRAVRALAALVVLLGCAAPRPSARPGPDVAPSAPPAPTADDVFAALKARDPARLSAILAANPELAGARKRSGLSAIAVALFTLNDDEETFVRPPENALLRALALRHPPLDVYDAAATGDLDRLRELLAGDRALATAVHPVLGITPLHLAAFAGSKEAVALLLASGAALDARSLNQFHNTPLIMSVLSDQRDVASELLERGANVEAEEEAGLRPLHLAAELGDAQMLELLIEHGASVNAKTAEGKTAVAIARERGRNDAVGVLRERGAR